MICPFKDIIFVDLRDRSGIAQVTASPETCSEEVFQAADSVRSEYVLAVKGTVRLRPEGMTNDKLETGEIDVVATELVILNKAKTPPFYLTDDVDVDENIRLKYRYLDLRRNKLKNNMLLRNEVLGKEVKEEKKKPFNKMLNIDAYIPQEYFNNEKIIYNRCTFGNSFFSNTSYGRNTR